jgi:hypothetical protein
LIAESATHQAIHEGLNIAAQFKTIREYYAHLTFMVEEGHRASDIVGGICALFRKGDHGKAAVDVALGHISWAKRAADADAGHRISRDQIARNDYRAAARFSPPDEPPAATTPPRRRAA